MPRSWWWELERGLKVPLKSFSGGVAAASSKELLPPPAHFIPAEILAAWKTNDQPFASRKSRHTPAQKAGLRYQTFVGDRLRGAGLGLLHSGPWYCYAHFGGSRKYCQPDFVVELQSDLLLVVEAKIRWTSDAWWQLDHLYLPVLRAAHPDATVVGLCVTRSYDPAIRVPSEVNLMFDLASVERSVRASAFNVLVLR